MIKIMIADGEVDPGEVHTVSVIYQELTGVAVSEDVIRAKATLAQSQGKDLQAALTDLAPHLSDEGKSTVLKAAVKVAIADGDFETAEQSLLTEIASALGMSEDQMRATVAELTQVA
jgi:tellurite resistance protein